jgi:hypothetical protein
MPIQSVASKVWESMSLQEYQNQMVLDNRLIDIFAQ